MSQPPLKPPQAATRVRLGEGVAQVVKTVLRLESSLRYEPLAQPLQLHLQLGYHQAQRECLHLIRPFPRNPSKPCQEAALLRQGEPHESFS